MQFPFNLVCEPLVAYKLRIYINVDIFLSPPLPPPLLQFKGKTQTAGKGRQQQWQQQAWNEEREWQQLEEEGEK